MHHSHVEPDEQIRATHPRASCPRSVNLAS